MMDLRAVFLSILVFHLVEASYIIKQMRLRHLLMSTTTCDKGLYFDPHLGEKGRCQPCSEICEGDSSRIGDAGACERHKDQCEVTQEESTQVPLITSDPPSPTWTDSATVAIAVATVSLAVLTTGILAWFICRNYRKRSNVDTEDRTSAPCLIKPVSPNSLPGSRDRICITAVSNEPLEAHQMALLQSHHVREFSSFDQNEDCHNGVVCHEPSIRYDAGQTDSFRPFM